jgi:hypothetical protein
MTKKILDLINFSSSTKERHFSKDNNSVEKKFALTTKILKPTSNNMYEIELVA